MQTQFTRTIRQWALVLSGASLLLTCTDPRPAVNAGIPLHSTATLDLGRLSSRCIRVSPRRSAVRGRPGHLSCQRNPRRGVHESPAITILRGRVPARRWLRRRCGLHHGRDRARRRTGPPSEARVEGPGGFSSDGTNFLSPGHRSGFGRKDPGGAHGTDGSGARQDGCHGEQASARPTLRSR